MRSFNYGGGVEIDVGIMLRQIEEGDTKGGIIIPKDKFKEVEGVAALAPSGHIVFLRQKY